MICKHCEIDKPENKFPKVKSWCTDCHRKASIKSRNKNIDKYKKYQKEYYYNWYRKNGRKRDATKNAAHQLVFRAVQQGLLKKPSSCGACNSSGQVEAHHDNYFEPLAVLWLCNSCHRNRHPGNSVA